MLIKVLIVLVAIVLLGAVVVLAVFGAVLPWVVTQSNQSITIVDTSGPPQTAIPTAPAATQAPSVGSLYRDESAGFQLTYPANWTLDPSKPIGSRASQALLLSPGTTAETLADGGSRISIVIYTWDPKNDLSAYVTRREAAWNASGSTIIEKTELKLADGRQAVSFIVESTDKQRDFLLITTAGEKYLEVAGQGKLALINEIALTLSPICFAPEDLIPFAFTPDSAKLMVRARSGVQIFDLRSGAQEAFIHSSQDVITAALSPDGQVLAWSLDDNTIQLLRISDQMVLHTLSGHTDMVTKLRFSPDGDFLVSASHDNSVRVWNMQGEELRSLQPVEALGIGISKDGSMLATVSFDGPVALWDLDTLEKIKDLAGSGGYDTSDAEFSPDGQYLAADLATGIFLWRVSDNSLVWNEVKNSMAVAFSPDGRYLAYSDVDNGNQVILASPDASQVILNFGRMQGPVFEFFFSPDGSLLAATDGIEIRIWQVEDGTLLYIGKTACP